MRFIYVTGEDSKNKLLTMKYSLINENAQGGVYVFKNKDEAKFSTEDELTNAGVLFALSNTLIF